MMINILNRHDPDSALVHNSFTLTYAEKFPFDASFETQNHKLVHLTFSQPCYKSRQKLKLSLRFNGHLPGEPGLAGVY